MQSTSYPVCIVTLSFVVFVVVMVVAGGGGDAAAASVVGDPAFLPLFFLGAKRIPRSSSSLKSKVAAPSPPPSPEPPQPKAPPAT